MLDDSKPKEQEIDATAPLLPRSAWGSNVAFFRVVFKAKKALDLIEKEAGFSMTDNK